MMRLVVQAMAEILGRWGFLLGAGWLVLTARLASESQLGSGSLGDYLAYVSIVPMALLWRVGQMRQNRRTDGWNTEERLRDVRGLRLPLAELIAALALLILTFVCAHLPTLAPGFQPGPENPASYAVPIKGSLSEGWTLDFGRPLPSHSRALIAFDWDAVPADEIDVPRTLHIGETSVRSSSIQPGELIEISWEAEEAHSGRLQIRLQTDRLTAPNLLRSAVRIRIERPTMQSLPRLLGRQFLYFFPLLACTFFLVRTLQVRGSLATAFALAFGALSTWNPSAVAEFTQSPFGYLTQGFLYLRDFLPWTAGLLATGKDMALDAGTSRLSDILFWQGIGAAFLLFSLVIRRRP